MPGAAVLSFAMTPVWIPPMQHIFAIATDVYTAGSMEAQVYTPRVVYSTYLPGSVEGQTFIPTTVAGTFNPGPVAIDSYTGGET